MDNLNDMFIIETNDNKIINVGIGDWGLGIGPNPQSPIPIPKYYN